MQYHRLLLNLQLKKVINCIVLWNVLFSLEIHVFVACSSGYAKVESHLLMLANEIFPDKTDWWQPQRNCPHTDSWTKAVCLPCFNEARVPHFKISKTFRTGPGFPLLSIRAVCHPDGHGRLKVESHWMTAAWMTPAPHGGIHSQERLFKINK